MAFGAAMSARASDWTDANDPTITYTALKTIKGDGSAYVITDIVPTGTDIVKTRVKMQSGTIGTETFFCARTAYMGNAFSSINNSRKLRVDRGNAQEATTGNVNVFSSNGEYLMEINFGKGSSTTEAVTLIRENGKNDKVIAELLRREGMTWPEGWGTAPVTHVPGYHGKGLASGFRRAFRRRIRTASARFRRISR